MADQAKKAVAAVNRRTITALPRISLRVRRAGLPRSGGPGSDPFPVPCTGKSVDSSSNSSKSESVSGGAGKTVPHVGHRTSRSGAIRRDVFRFVRQSGQAKVTVVMDHDPMKSGMNADESNLLS